MSGIALGPVLRACSPSAVPGVAAPPADADEVERLRVLGYLE